MRALIFLLFTLVSPVSAYSQNAIPDDVVARMRQLIRSELELQMRQGSGGGMCSEGDTFESAERRIGLLEQSLHLAESTKADKFTNLIGFFREKMIHKCCELSGKTPPQGTDRSEGRGGRGSGRGLGRGLGRGGG